MLKDKKKDDRPRLVAAANTSDHRELKDEFEILGIKLKDDEGKPLFKSTNDQMWKAIELFNKHYNKILKEKKVLVASA